MKKIEAIIRKSKFDEVVNALHDAEVYFFSYWDVTGVGNEKIGKVYRGISYSTKDIQRRCLSIIVSDSFVNKTVDAILKSGDNKGNQCSRKKVDGNYCTIHKKYKLN